MDCMPHQFVPHLPIQFVLLALLLATATNIELDNVRQRRRRFVPAVASLAH